MPKNRAGEQVSVEEWLSIRRNAALKIDPKSAEVIAWWGQILDPYGVHPDLPEECDQLGKMYFARTPGDVWVSFDDLPAATRDALCEKAKAKTKAAFKIEFDIGSTESGSSDELVVALAAMAQGLASIAKAVAEKRSSERLSMFDRSRAKD
jgi:hypothetical protein